MLSLLFVLLLHCTVRARLVASEDVRTNFMSTVFERSAMENNIGSGSGFTIVPSVATHGVDVIFHNVTEQEILRDYFSVENFTESFFLVISMVNPDVVLLSWRRTEPPQGDRFDVIVTVVVVEGMATLPAPEAIQLISTTLQDPRVHMLPMQPHNVSFSGTFPSVSIFGDVNGTVLLGATVILTCISNGNPIPSVTWLKDGSRLSGNALDRNGILYIREFALQNSGNYTCIATSELGSAETHVGLIAVRKCEEVFQHSCVGGICLPVVKECDGRVDCVDGSDEMGCTPPTPLCRPDEMECQGAGGGCAFIGSVCDGVNNCADGSDEQNCTAIMASQSRCSANQLSCSDECVPLALLCDGTLDCADREDEQRCAPYDEVVSEGSLVIASLGTNITMSCAALGGFPSPYVTWFKNLSPLEPSHRFVVMSTSGAGSLVITDVTADDAGRYTCMIGSNMEARLIQPDTRLVVATENRGNISYCNDSQGTLFNVGEQYLFAMTTSANLGTAEAADVIFVVDESGSMVGEHSWLRRLVFELQNSLLLANVGIDAAHPNMYALVGFARDDDAARSGIVIQDLGTMQQFVSALGQLTLTGIFEDGYSGIDVALRNISPRSGTAKQLVLVTDEHRGILNFRLSKEIIVERLRLEGFKLNVVVNQVFESEVGTDPVMGIDSTGMGYVFNSTVPELYSKVMGGQASVAKGYQSTNTDYVEPALQLGGGAWNLNILRLDEKMTTAFTNALVHAKVEEIQSSFKACFRCTCGELDSQCVRSTFSLHKCSGVVDNVAEPVVVVNPLRTRRPLGSNVKFQCLMHPVNLLEPILQYSWYHRLGGSIVLLLSGSNDTLELEQVMEDDTGQYICEVETRSGMKRNASSTLLVFIPPVQVVVTPTNPDVGPGENVTIVCGVDPSIPVSRYRWTFNGHPLPPNAMALMNGTHSLLTITGFGAGNVGVYLCRAVGLTAASSNESDVLEVKILGQSNLTVSLTEPASFTCSVRCVAPDITCIGVLAEWSRRRGDGGTQQLPNGTSVSSSHTNATLHFPSTSVEDAGGYLCTGRVLDFSQTVEAYLTVNAVPVTIVTPKKATTIPGQPVTLQCSSDVPHSTCSFYKEDNDNGTIIVTGQGGVDLHILSAQSSDAGNYVCECSNSEGSSEDNGTISLDCVVRQTDVVASSEMVELCQANVPEGTATAACVVFIVDESRSMQNEHHWLIGFTQLLQEKLYEAGIGQTQLANRYGLVGFGSAFYEEGRVINLMDNGLEMAGADRLEYGINKLMLNGRNEDGYAGIEVARQLMMRNQQCRLSNVARQFILVTDEERDSVTAELNKSVVFNRLKDFGLLNIAVNEAFECKSGEGLYDFTEVLGLDGNQKGYSAETGEEMVTTECRPKPDSGYVTTNEDYTELAFQLGGGAWNLQQLREGGVTTSSFTKAFLTVKVNEIVDQLNCVTCLCSAGELECGQELTESTPSPP